MTRVKILYLVGVSVKTVKNILRNGEENAENVLRSGAVACLSIIHED